MSSPYRHLHIALQALGSTADAVADILSTGGWTGIRGYDDRCPIARYLLDVIPDARTVMVSAFRTAVWTVTGASAEADTPTGPAEFVTAFDNGDFPELADPWSATDDTDDDMAAVPA